MTTVEKLKAARKLITPKKRWLQHQFSVTFFGLPVEPTSFLARKFCADGALTAVGCLGDGPEWWALARAVGGSPIRFNDTPGRTHAEVLAAFDKAIAVEEAKA